MLYKNKRHFADDHDEEETGGLVEQKTFDMNNVLLSLNYFTGFGATIIEASKKLDADEEAAEDEERGSRKDSDEDADMKADLGDSDDEEVKQEIDLMFELNNFARELIGKEPLKLGEQESAQDKTFHKSRTIKPSEAKTPFNHRDDPLRFSAAMPTPIAGGDRFVRDSGLG